MATNIPLVCDGCSRNILPPQVALHMPNGVYHSGCYPYTSETVTVGPAVDWQSRALAAEAENAKLREALKPFADSSEDWHEMGDTRVVSVDGGLTVADLRRASAAMKHV